MATASQASTDQHSNWHSAFAMAPYPARWDPYASSSRSSCASLMAARCYKGGSQQGPALPDAVREQARTKSKRV